MKLRGFTIIELIIVITIMGILLILGVVNLRGSQANARDDERKGDVGAIALNLEGYYKGVNDTGGVGTYPSTTSSDASNELITTYLPDIDIKSLLAPGVNDPDKSFISAIDNNAQTPTISQYMYQPLQSSGALCTSILQGCRKFNIYYRLETDNTVYKITSKNQ
jgi:prepilin-type N-terminal cleavage/methylation domain-containing protein